MDEEEDDDIFDSSNGVKEFNASAKVLKTDEDEDNKTGEELEEGEEEGEEVEESDSDIDIITERKDEPKSESKAEPVQMQGGSTVRASSVRTPALDQTARPSSRSAVKLETPAKAAPPRSGASYPAVKSSKVDLDAKPIYEPTGKRITEIDMDADFPEDDKPWRRPGTDMTDYFNYGFDEFTWASYCLKQETLRKEVADSKKQMEDMQSFLGMPGMPPIPGMSAAASGSMPPMGDIPPEMAQMMQQMMASGMDPSQMTTDMFMQQMMQGQAGGGGGGQGNYGGNQGYGQQGHNQQQVGYSYGAGGGGGSGGGGGRGRGQNRRNWQ